MLDLGIQYLMAYAYSLNHVNASSENRFDAKLLLKVQRKL